MVFGTSSAKDSLDSYQSVEESFGVLNALMLAVVALAVVSAVTQGFRDPLFDSEESRLEPEKPS
jgi:hypothetical protein